MYIEFLRPGNVATFLLTFIIGLLIAKLLRSRGFGGFLTYMAAIVVVLIIINGLWKGYSVFFDRITYNLESLISQNLAGVIGTIVGLIAGMFFFRKREKQ